MYDVQCTSNRTSHFCFLFYVAAIGLMCCVFATNFFICINSCSSLKLLTELIEIVCKNWGKQNFKLSIELIVF